MKMLNLRQSLVILTLFAVLTAFVATGCGAAAGVGAVTSNLVGGFAVKGPIKNGKVNAYVLLPDGEKGILLAEGSTDEKGAFQLTIEDYEGPVWLEVVSGTTLDMLLEDRVLGPLGMADTVTLVKSEDPRTARICSAYVDSGGTWSRYWHPDDDVLYPFAMGSQSLYCTPLDYARFLAL